MARILILGGYGLTGRLLASHLLEQSEAHIILAGRSLEKAQAYAEELNSTFKGERVSSIYVDASSKETLLEALKNVDMLLVAAPTTQYADIVIHAALESEVDYLDVQLDAKKYALLNSLATEIKHAGRCFITEAGFHPGLLAAMVHSAALQFDRMDSAIMACYLNVGRTPYSEAVDELMEFFRHYQSQVFKGAGWTRPGSFDIRKIDFGGEVGVRKCFSMFLEELRPLPGMYPTLQELGFFMSETHWIVDWIIFPLIFAGLKIGPRRATSRLGKILWWSMKTFSKPPYLVSLKIEVKGEKNQKPVTFESFISHADSYELTAIPVVACLLQYLDGTVRRPGLWMMGHLVEPLRFYNDMEKMGVKISSDTI
jgi:hypothetical protein